MLKRSITYTNPFTDEEVTEEHYFHISKADMVEMEMEEHNLAYKAKDGQDYTGMQAKLMKIIDSEDGKAIIAELKEIIRRSYGRKVEDRFVKSSDIWTEFSSSEAFSQLLFELCTDAEKAAEFMNGVIPKNLAAEAQQLAAQSADISDRGEPATVTQLYSPPQGDSAESESVPGSNAWVEKRKPEIDAATPDNPVELNSDDITLLEASQLQTGLADGRFKLS